MKKVLPFTLDVPLKAFSYYSFYLGILKMHDIDIISLLLNHFINSNYDHTNGFFSYVEERRLPALFSRDKFSTELENPQQFIKDAINAESYIIIDIDHYFISNLPFHFVHELLIYGYDDESEVFLAAGHVLDEKLKMLQQRPITISYSDLISAYHSAHSLKKRKYTNFVIKMKKKNINDNLNIKKIKFDLFLYTYNIIPYIFIHSFNRLAYKMFRLQYIKRYKSGKFKFDNRFLKVMQERAALFKLLIERLSVENELGNNCKDLYNILTKALMITAKCNAKYNESNDDDRLKVLEKINIALKQAENIEYELVKDLLLLLRHR